MILFQLRARGKWRDAEIAASLSSPTGPHQQAYLYSNPARWHSFSSIGSMEVAGICLLDKLNSLRQDCDVCNKWCKPVQPWEHRWPFRLQMRQLLVALTLIRSCFIRLVRALKAWVYDHFLEFLPPLIDSQRLLCRCHTEIPIARG